MINKSLLALLWIFCLFWQSASANDLPKRLTVALSVDSYPYMFTDDKGELAGLAVDYWREVGRLQGIEIQFTGADWPDTIKLLQQGKVDLHGAIARTPQRSAQYILTDLNIDALSNIYVLRDLSSVTKIADLQPFVIGVVENTGHLAKLQKQLPQGNYKYFPNVTALYQAAIEGQIAAFTGLDRLSPRYAQYDKLNLLFPMYRRLPLSRMELAFAVLPQNSPLAASLAQATAKLPRSFLDELERTWLGVPAQKDTLLLGVPIDNPPYMNVSAQGEAQGMFVDIWRLWAEKNRVRIAFVPDSSQNNLQNLAKGRIDILIAFPDNKDLPENVSATYQLYNFPSAFFHLKSSAVTDPAQASSGAIGLFDNAPYTDELKQRYPQLEHKFYRQLPDMINAALSGEIIGFFGASVIIPQRLQQLNLTEMFSSAEDINVAAPIYTLIQSQRSVLAEQIRDGFASIPLDQFIALEQQWIAETDKQYFAKFRQQVPLTEAEQDWIKQHPVLRVGMLRDWAPMEFADEKDQPAGVTVDMFNLLAERLKLGFEFVFYDDFDTMLAQLRQKQIDLIGNVSEREERRSYARFTDVFWAMQWAVISGNNNVTLTNTAQLNGSKVAVYRDYELARRLPLLYPQIDVVQVASLRDALVMLQNGEVDYAVDSIEAASEMIRQSHFVGLRAHIIEDLPEYPSLIALREDYGPLTVILNKGLRGITKEERQQLYQKWFNFQITQGVNRQQLNTLMWRIGGIATVLLIFILAWNLSLRREVRLRRAAEQKMRFMATHDDLTKLPNRSLIKERIEQALLQHARHNEILALLFIDLDGFKEVNDAHGHDAGDELLLKLSELLKEAVRKSDTVARFGGDEFVVLLTGLLSRDDAAIVAEKILHQLNEPLTLSVGDVKIGASIGIAVYPYDGTDSAKLLKVADSLMYRIKQQGKNRYCFSKAAF